MGSKLSSCPGLNNFSSLARLAHAYPAVKDGERKEHNFMYDCLFEVGEALFWVDTEWRNEYDSS